MELTQDVIIAGGGGIGRAVGLLLANYPEFRGHILIGDMYTEVAEEAAAWIREGRSHPVEITSFTLPEKGVDIFANITRAGGVLLDCLPGQEAPRMASVALQYSMHYVNLTEYVNETAQIQEMARDAETGFVLQTGLAPGFVNVLAQSLYDEFVNRYHPEIVGRVTMRVGGLTTHTRAPHYYGFTWSTIGVATEYMMPCLAIRDFKQKWLDALSEREEIIIDGSLYEADLTSGGAADLPQSLEGKVRDLDYKTLRYPGHYKWVDKLRAKVGQDEDAIHALEQEMMSVVPAVEEDLIVVYAAVTGQIGPLQIGGKTLRAIQATTAAPMAECARMMMSGRYRGVILQSQIDAHQFLAGPFIDRVYTRRRHHNGVPLHIS
jgi:saccharopine dehydrogenase-like NADP-dependent oxidoreductase